MVSPWAYKIELNEVRIKNTIVPKKIMSVYCFDRKILSSELPINFNRSYEKKIPIEEIKIANKKAYINE